jgi:DNA-binding HxlR family transcriptional regulator
MATKRMEPELEHPQANCRAREMLTRVGDKWSLHVIHVLGGASTASASECSP